MRYSPCRSQCRPASQPPAVPWCSVWRFWPLEHLSPRTPAAPRDALSSPGAPPDGNTHLTSMHLKHTVTTVLKKYIASDSFTYNITFHNVNYNYIRIKSRISSGKTKNIKERIVLLGPVRRSVEVRTRLKTTHQRILRARECF